MALDPFIEANMRLLVSGGAGFIGSHLVDKLMENAKNEVIVMDNYFTGSKVNLKQWIGHPRFELIRHCDVTEPLLVEVDQIYHLACLDSPIFYKYNDYNPVKTLKTNVIGTLNMLGLAKRVGASNEHLTVQLPGTQTRSFCYVADMVLQGLETATNYVEDMDEWLGIFNVKLRHMREDIESCRQVPANIPIEAVDFSHISEQVKLRAHAYNVLEFCGFVEMVDLLLGHGLRALFHRAELKTLVSLHGNEEKVENSHMMRPQSLLGHLNSRTKPRS